MRCWLVEIGEPLPIDPGHPRLMRTGLVARRLVERGHEVVWWASRFDHARRTNRGVAASNVSLDGLLTIVLLEGFRYRRSMSVARVLHHKATARRFRRLASQAEVPDVIVCSVPTLELAAEAVAYGTARRVPVLLDLRDMWPDIWLELIPRRARRIARALWGRVFEDFATTCRNASGLLGITDEFLDWGLGYAGRPQEEHDRVVPHAYPTTTLSEASLALAAQKWTDLGITGRPDQFVVCFIGTLSRRLTRHGFLHDCVSASSMLAARCPNLRTVICGGGEDLLYWSGMAHSSPNVVASGRVDHAELSVLLERSRVGLVPYPNTPDFVRSIPNKVAEYVSMGLPVVSSLDGALGRFLRVHECGTTYTPRDPASLAGQIERLYSDQAFWSQMSRNAQQAFTSHLSAEQVYGDLVGHLEAIVAARSTATVPQVLCDVPE